jgi:hypothetical protein
MLGVQSLNFSVMLVADPGILLQKSFAGVVLRRASLQRRFKLTDSRSLVRESGLHLIELQLAASMPQFLATD